MNKNNQPLDILRQAAELQQKKSQDYQNPNSRIRQAQYYPRGCSTISDIMLGKILRIQSVIEAMENDTSYSQNFESLEDSAIDLINYATFFVSYIRGGIDGQDPDRDFLNRPKGEDIE